MTDWSDVPVFRDLQQSPNVVVRPSAYGLVVHADGQLALVRTSQGLFLPGGGIEANETPHDTVVRELWEECGLGVLIGSWTAKAVDFIYSPSDRVDFEKRSTFVDAHWTGRRGEAQEPDHALEWTTTSDALTRLRDPSHRWAVAQWLERSAGLSESSATRSS